MSTFHRLGNRGPERTVLQESKYGTGLVVSPPTIQIFAHHAHPHPRLLHCVGPKEQMPQFGLR